VRTQCPEQLDPEPRSDLVVVGRYLRQPHDGRLAGQSLRQGSAGQSSVPADLEENEFVRMSRGNAIGDDRQLARPFHLGPGRGGKAKPVRT
jgi:hypothetical protein